MRELNKKDTSRGGIFDFLLRS